MRPQAKRLPLIPVQALARPMRLRLQGRNQSCKPGRGLEACPDGGTRASLAAWTCYADERREISIRILAFSSSNGAASASVTACMLSTVDTLTFSA